MNRRSAQRVVAVVPLFEPAPEAAVGIRAAAAQVDAVVLVDDGSPTDLRSFVDALELPSVRLLVSSANSGIAHALNRGVETALDELDADLVVTLDQDSALEPDYVERAVDAVQALRASGVPFAAIGAGVVDGKPNRGDHLEGLPFRLTHETIQSGLVFPRAVLDALGPFDESFFIDCVDTDYILRGWAHGLPTVLAPECRMSHALGEGIRVTLPLISRRRDHVVPYHRPVRRYYITRNRVRLVARHARSSPGWALRQTCEQAKYSALDLIWGPRRVGQVLATVLGVLHGAAGRGGAASARTSAIVSGTAARRSSAAAATAL